MVLHAPILCGLVVLIGMSSTVDSFPGHHGYFVHRKNFLSHGSHHHSTLLSGEGKRLAVISSGLSHGEGIPWSRINGLLTQHRGSIIAPLDRLHGAESKLLLDDHELFNDEADHSLYGIGHKNEDLIPDRHIYTFDIPERVSHDYTLFPNGIALRPSYQIRRGWRKPICGWHKIFKQPYERRFLSRSWPSQDDLFETTHTEYLHT